MVQTTPAKCSDQAPPLQDASQSAATQAFLRHPRPKPPQNHCQTTPKRNPPKPTQPQTGSPLPPCCAAGAAAHQPGQGAGRRRSERGCERIGRPPASRLAPGQSRFETGFDSSLQLFCALAAPRLPTGWPRPSRAWPAAVRAHLTPPPSNPANPETPQCRPRFKPPNAPAPTSPPPQKKGEEEDILGRALRRAVEAGDPDLTYLSGWRGGVIGGADWRAERGAFDCGERRGGVGKERWPGWGPERVG